MKYSFALADVGKLVLESRAGESDRHISLKLLAYLLFHDQTGGLPLRIEQGVGQRHKPDLVATEPYTDVVRWWIDCGDIGVKRLARIVEKNRHAQIVIVKKTGNEAAAYAKEATRFVPQNAAIRYIGFDESFVPAVLNEMRGTNTVVHLPAPPDTLALHFNSREIHSKLFWTE